MIHHFCRYEINLEAYQIQEIPQAIVPYEEKFERSLCTEIRRFQKELNWSEMWDTLDVVSRLLHGWRFWVFRPKNQIKGWVWVDPDKAEIKNLYVSKWFRKQGWGTKLILAGLNDLLDLDKDVALYRTDTWNTASKKSIERVLELTGITSKLFFTEENY